MFHDATPVNRSIEVLKSRFLHPTTGMDELLFGDDCGNGDDKANGF